MTASTIRVKQYEKAQKIYFWSAIFTAIFIIAVSVLRAIYNDFDLRPTDFLIFLLAPINYFSGLWLKKKYGQQFIKWEDETLSFRSKQSKNTTSISYQNIAEISIKLDAVEIIHGGKKDSINLEDYMEYEDRVAIKNNFTKLKEELGV